MCQTVKYIAPRRGGRSLYFGSEVVVLVLLSFLGFCSYYRPLLLLFAEDAVGNYKQNSERRVVRTAEFFTSFAKLKSALC